jgi:replicative DNA helicase
MQNKNTGKIKSGVPTGFTLLDRNLSGWQNGDLIIIAGRPGMGKTTFALNSMVYALEMGYKPYVLSLEMSGIQLTNKIIAQKMGFSPAQIRHGHVKNEDSARVLSDLPQCFYTDNMLIDDNVGMDIHQLKAKITMAKMKYGVDLLMVDYLQLIQSKQFNREQAISEISRNLKLLAKELDIPVIALSQLSRSVESRTDKKPLLSDLRESGAIEQDADTVIFIFRPEYYQVTEYEDGTSTKDTAQVIVAKNRNGALDEIMLSCRLQNSIFEDYKTETEYGKFSKSSSW